MLELKNASRRFTDGEVVNAINGINLRIDDGEFIAVIGPSGCGKSTLLYTLGLLDGIDEGEYFIDDKRVDQYSNRERANLRNKTFGFVFQSFNLLSRTTAFDNVMLPLQYGRVSEASTKTRQVLEQVDLWEKRKNWPNQLSGGQQQRVAIARALVTKPEVILADEPTGNLDSKTSLDILNLFKNIHKTGTTVIMVTHNPELLTYANRVITMKDGTIVKDEQLKK